MGDIMHTLIKLITNEDGDTCDPVWHLLNPDSGSGNNILCTGEYIGLGESECVYEEKTVKRGGITCQPCIEQIKALQNIKL